MITGQVVGVVFQPGGKVYSFDPAGLELRWDEKVICHTARGRELGRVVQPNHESTEEIPGPLKRVVRRADAADEQQARENALEAKRAIREFRHQCRLHNLRLKPISAEMVFDQSRIVFNFATEEKVDTSALRSDLASALHRRIDLRQVGPRDQGRLCGGHGLCGGGKMCSSRYPCHEQPITLKMAKDQELPMNPGRITGLCGRLRCCLAFEHPVYRSFRDRAPAVGRRVTTPHGNGVVRSYEVLNDACMVDLEGNTTVEVKLDEMHEVAG